MNQKHFVPFGYRNSVFFSSFKFISYNTLTNQYNINQCSYISLDTVLMTSGLYLKSLCTTAQAGSSPCLQPLVKCIVRCRASFLSNWSVLKIVVGKGYTDYRQYNRFNFFFISLVGRRDRKCLRKLFQLYQLLDRRPQSYRAVDTYCLFVVNALTSSYGTRLGRRLRLDVVKKVYKR